MESILKEGFLTKKARKKHCWKTRWFVLEEDRLTYCKKKDRKTLVGSIRLFGCSVAYPVDGYEKRKGVFQLSTPRGKQHLLQASTDGEREVWAHAITAVIRAKATRKSRPTSIRRRLATTIDLSDILGAMQDLDAGVPMVTYNLNGSEHKKCFTGSESVDWLCLWSFVSDREEGTKLMQTLIKLAHILPVQQATNAGDTVHTFLDSPVALYKFSSFVPRQATNSIFGSSSSDSSSDSSEGEMTDGDPTEDSKPKKGKIVKEGFLLKRGYLRKQWKSRRVIVREKPSTIEYYCTSKHDKEPLKVISLDGAKVLNRQEAKQKTSNVQGTPGDTKDKHKLVFCIQTSEDRTLVFQAEDEHQKQQWMAAIGAACTGAQFF